MNLDEWRARRAEGIEAELPSGLTVQLRRVSIPDIIRHGNVPKNLSKMVEDGLFGRPIVTGEEEGASIKDFEQYREFVEFMASQALIGPAGLEISELPWQDQYAIWLWLTEGPEQRTLRTFPGEAS